MNKYIQDTIRNNLRSIIWDLSLPQQKTVSEVVRGLFTVGKPILSLLSQDENKTAKKQSEKYSFHLWNIELQNKIDDFALRKAKQGVRRNTIIAYDLTDINKDCAKKMEKISRVFDWSKRTSANWFTLHWVWINNILIKLEVHESEDKTQNQVRKSIVTNISEKLNKKWIWVFDRWNDDKQFFKYLCHNLKVEFIARLKRDRKVVIKKSGVKRRVDELPEWKYEVQLMNKNNYKLDTRYTYTLIISNDEKTKDMIYLLSSIDIDKYSSKQFTNMYLERWWVENIFKRVKTKFNLEAVRVLKYERFLNLISLIQFAVVVVTLIFNQIQKSTNSLITWILMLYKKFIRLKSLTFNIDSFITYLNNHLEPLIFRNKPSEQLSLLSRRQLRKIAMSQL